MFVRFVVGSDGEHHRELTGIAIEAAISSRRAGSANRRAMLKERLGPDVVCVDGSDYGATHPKHGRSLDLD
jgi:hypothetical protein